jgi:hypothetical protein
MSYLIKLFFCTIYLLSNIAYAQDTNAGLPQLDLETYPSLMFWTILSLIIGYFFYELLNYSKY